MFTDSYELNINALYADVTIWDATWENWSWGFPTWSDTNQAVQPLKKARGLKFRIKEVEGLYY